MEKSNKRGKIPQSDWPQIMARYEAGETLASIAKTYDCSPPAISYIVSRSRARHTNTPATPAATEPQLVKAHPHAPAAQAGAVDASTAPGTEAAALAPSVQNGAEGPSQAPLFAQDAAPPFADREFAGNSGNGAGLPSRDTDRNFATRNGADADPDHRQSAFPGLPPAAIRPAIGAAQPNPVPPSPAPPPDERRTLHLGFGNGATHPSNAAEPRPYQGNGGGMPTSDPPRNTAYSNPPPAAPQQGIGEPHQPRPALPPQRPYDQPRHEYGPREHEQRPASGDVSNKAAGSYIDKELRARVDIDIAAFLSAFDAALVQDTQGSRSALREATDRLLRAGARTRIELERLEARVPLPSRDSTARAEPNWPPR